MAPTFPSNSTFGFHASAPPTPTRALTSPSFTLTSLPSASPTVLTSDPIDVRHRNQVAFFLVFLLVACIIAVWALMEFKHRMIVEFEEKEYGENPVDLERQEDTHYQSPVVEDVPAEPQRANAGQREPAPG
ncbi:hypothetical protein EDC01DRAFT_632585 [Geopyxis carbonaria]|nr:hypothetical protein EDC01DRAFT_632585 [Geopyxis carbonaria]